MLCFYNLEQLIPGAVGNAHSLPDGDVPFFSQTRLSACAAGELEQQPH